MTPQRINMISLSTADLPRARAFYTTLGWVEAEGGNDKIAFFQLAGQYFSIYDRAALAEDIGQDIPATTTGGVTLAINYDNPQQVDAAYDAAIDAGATDLRRPSEIFWGGYSGNYADPDGHLWEVAHNPFWKFDTEGQIDHG
ncbi:glyoxalase [Amylibacter marinus]|uniref:Glyoxalase n=1 Tax=Amylibacter marinus TaxID=1475483 RepID=A0ABQ5VWS0_9RHOB|nr:VOC family protein [Amylibacter marinus]GLQ35676.1 glyoxalase [Amylibacter marinus]